MSFVVISHGSGGSNLVHRDTTIYLAKHGYIVTALFHLKNNFKNNSTEGALENWKNRPKHISATLDSILNGVKLLYLA